MAVTWGSIVGGYGRIGIDVSISNSNTTSTVTFKVLFWSKYSVSDTSNTLYFDWNTSTATTSRGSKSISTTSDSGGWNTKNQKLLYTTSTSYTRGTSDQTKYCAAKLTGVERVGGTMTHSRSFVIPKKPSYTVSYNANGGSGAPGKQTKWYGTNLTLSSTKPTRTGYTFQGWGTSSGDTTVDYAAGATYSANAAITLYAIWKIITYTVSYNANGGSGAPGNQTKNYGATLKLSTTKPTRTNYNFKGWATSSNGSVAYASGANYTANASVTLYAVWELAYWVPKITNLKVSRCNSDGSANEAGTYYSLSFNWECCQITGTNPVKSITHKLGSGTAQAISVNTSSTSGSVSIVSGNGAADVDTTYTIQVTITDKLNGSYTASVTLAATRFPIDFKAGGKGVAIGKPAELDDYLDVYFKSRFRHEVVLDQVNQIYGLDSSTGELVQAFQPLSETGNTVVGFGNYYRNLGTTNIYGNGMNLISKGNIVITAPSQGISNRKYGENVVLWSGEYYMRENQTATLSQSIAAQPNGIALIFSRYADGKAINEQMMCCFVPKYYPEIYSGCGMSVTLNSPWANGIKYLYIRNTAIVGNAKNDDSYTVRGITYDNKVFILRQVIGL